MAVSLDSELEWNSITTLRIKDVAFISDILHGGLQPEEGAEVQLLQEADRAEGGAEDGAAAQGARQRLPPPMLSVRGTDISNTLPTHFVLSN